MNVLIRLVLLLLAGLVGWFVGVFIGYGLVGLGYLLLGWQLDLTLPLLTAIIGAFGAVGWTGWRMASNT